MRGKWWQSCLSSGKVKVNPDDQAATALKHATVSPFLDVTKFAKTFPLDNFLVGMFFE